MERNPSNIAACLFSCTLESCKEAGAYRGFEITSRGTSFNAQNIMHVSLVNDLTAISLDGDNSSGGANDGKLPPSFT